MLTLLAAATTLVASVMPLLPGGDLESTVWTSYIPGELDTWGGFLGGGPSNYYNVMFEVTTGTGNTSPVIQAGLPMTAVAISVVDLGAGLPFALVGVFDANLVLDSTGHTPDLTKPISKVISPPLPPTAMFEYVSFDLPDAMIPVGATRVHAVVQLPPNDYASLLNVAGDYNPPSSNTSCYTTDGYVYPATWSGEVDLGISLGQDNTSTTSCKKSDRQVNGRLRTSSGKVAQAAEGDEITTHVRAGQFLQLAFFGNQPGDVFRIYLMSPACVPMLPVGPVVATVPDPDGDGSFIRSKVAWPYGLGASTFHFAAVWGEPGCPDPVSGFTNCVTIISDPDPTFGVIDDGTTEDWAVVSLPAGPSDFMNNDFGDPQLAHVNGVTGMQIAVLDFGTAIPQFPRAGISAPNFTIDPSGQTPDVTGSGLLAQITPFTFPPGTIATTSAQYVTQPLSVPAASLGNRLHGWLQMPPGEPGNLWIGNDKDYSEQDASFYSGRAYSAIASRWRRGVFGIRLVTN